MFKERVVLTQLRRLGQASKCDLTAATGISRQTTVDIVNALERDRLVMKVGKRLGRVGQPSILYAINPASVYGIGLHVARARQELIVADFAGQICHRKLTTKPQPYVDDILELLSGGLKQIVATGVPRSVISGVGIALSHELWCRRTGERQKIPLGLLSEWDDRNVASEASKMLGLPVYLENDTRAAAMAEYLLGAGREYGTFLYVSIGPQISGALVLAGSLETGAHGKAATIGAIPVGPSRLAGSERSGNGGAVLGDRASLISLIRHLQANGVNVRDISELPDLVHESRTLVQEWIEDCIDALQSAITACLAVVDVQAVVLNSTLPPMVMMEIAERLERGLKSAEPIGLVVPQFSLSSLPTDAPLLGSAILPINANFVPGRDGGPQVA